MAESIVPTRPFTRERAKHAAVLFESGCSIAEIADRMSVAERTVKRYLRWGRTLLAAERYAIAEAYREQRAAASAGETS